jgi:hypothetical protein
MTAIKQTLQRWRPLALGIALTPFAWQWGRIDDDPCVYAVGPLMFCVQWR